MCTLTFVTYACKEYQVSAKHASATMPKVQLFTWVLDRLVLVQVYQEPPFDPEHLITSAVTRAEAQARNKHIADSVLVKAMKVNCTNYALHGSSTEGMLCMPSCLQIMP